VLVLGTNDLVKELFVDHVPGRTNLTTSLQLAVLAARATGKVVLDGVYNDVKDVEGYLAEVEQGRQLGFDGKTIIHPGQIEGANNGFAPSPEAVESARGLIEAWNARTTGVATYNGKLVESLHVESAERTLAIADAIAALQA
jgi:citrate lyase subunit beta/citryl-CoA lyase